MPKLVVKNDNGSGLAEVDLTNPSLLGHTLVLEVEKVGFTLDIPRSKDVDAKTAWIGLRPENGRSMLLALSTDSNLLPDSTVIQAEGAVTLDQLTTALDEAMDKFTTLISKPKKEW